MSKYVKNLKHALRMEGYSSEELIGKKIGVLEKMITQTMGMDKFTSLSKNW